MDSLVGIFTDLVERGWVPDFLVRIGIRSLLRQRLREISHNNNMEQQRDAERRWIEQLRGSAIAIETRAANEQHYEVPPRFFTTCLGPRLKYSSCVFPRGSATTLGEAEEAMLALSCERAGVRDGMAVLDLGCGWGSMALWVAEKYPAAQVTAVSNSAPQREFIEGRARERNLRNVRVITCDANEFAPADGVRFDRVISVEMFEHMRNYERLLARIATWLKPDGRLFVHIFTHRFASYPFETEGSSNWMAKNFFTGGQMPSDYLLLNFQRDLVLENHWRVNGVHYSRTLEAWLQLTDRNRAAVVPLLHAAYNGNGYRWYNRWRMFFLACSELFAFNGGNEWFVSHYLFSPRPSAAGATSATTTTA